jgi:hypothetical protein
MLPVSESGALYREESSGQGIFVQLSRVFDLSGFVARNLSGCPVTRWRRKSTARGTKGRFQMACKGEQKKTG